MSAVQACAGGLVFDNTGRLLVVRRGRAPGAGLWSVPGGRCLPGESPAAACVREVAEETGLRVRVLRLAGRVERGGSDGVSDGLVFDIADFVCTLTGAADTPVAGDDAADARWVTRAELAALPLVPGLVEALSGWDCLPRI